MRALAEIQEKQNLETRMNTKNLGAILITTLS